MRFCIFLAAIFGLIEVASAEDAIDYLRQIKPVLQSRCYACHGALKQKGDLRLDTAALAIKGGKNPSVVAPGDIEASTLIERISAKDETERMPPEGEPLKPMEIALLRAWIGQGAKAPSEEQPERDPRDHWAFRAPVRPVVPTFENSELLNNPIDAFIGIEQRKRGLAPQPPADKRVWLRRVSLDLVGLPPTPEELEMFVADDTPGAYDKVVTRLLESPHHGERWGRHWMDIWRYSDWWGLGAEVRNSQKHIWHWRDWIIESLNADKGYDQMLREMLASDELYPDDLNRLRASGFLARQYFKFNRTSWLDEVVEHTSKAMLGLTVNCAKCHDHKYDPLLQVEYYRLRAIFEPYQVRTDMVPGEIDLEKDGIPRAFDCNLEAPTFLHIRGDDRNPNKTRPLAPGFPAFLSSGAVKIEPVSLSVEAHEPGLRPFVLEAHLRLADLRISQARTALEEARKTLKETSPPLDQAKLAVVLAEKALVAASAQPASIQARAAADRARQEQPPPKNLDALIADAVRAERLAAVAKADEELSRSELEMLRASGDKKPAAEKKLAAAKAALESARTAIKTPGGSYTSLKGSLKTLESNLETEASRGKPFPKTSTGRRSAYARWITDRKNPLTARVAVNHLWARHFGKPLVPTVFDFGRKGAPPTHPELLDWLAVELMDSGWSMKHIHRLIVTSKTYQRTSSSAGVSERTQSADPENRYYWRANPIRMESEIIRDSMLYLAGDLDPALGGPSIPVKDEASRRRSLYFVHSHNEHQTFLSTFDDASVLECYRRAESVVPQQALALENSALAITTAEKIARGITAVNPDAPDDDFINSAFLTVLSVEPSVSERATVREALARFADVARRKSQPHPEMQARGRLIHALLNHNDFVTIR